MKKQKNLKDQKKCVSEMKYSEVMKYIQDTFKSKGRHMSVQDLTETKKKSPDPTISITFINHSKKD
jgi:hypothetical protein